MDALRKQFFADDVRYHVPGRSPLAGDYEGPEQVLQFFARVFELSGGTFSAELHDVLANDEHAVALYNVRAERAGKQLTDNEVLIFHIRDGKVSEAWIQSTDQYAQDEFWS
jgi:ketosteroid isomerase-like protein